MNPNTHEIAPEEIMAFVDGEMSGVWSDFVGGHVAGCEECQRTVADVRKNAAMLQGWKVEAIPARVEQAVHSAAKSGVVPRRGGIRLIPVWLRWAGGLAVAAVVVLVFTLQSTRLMRMQNQVEEQNSLSATMSEPSRRSAEFTNRASQVESYKQALEMKERAQLSESLENQNISQFARLSAGVASDDIRTQAPPPSPQSPSPMIARTVSLTIVVKDFAASRATVDAILAKRHGYSAEMTVNTTEGSAQTLQASLRVPATELAATLADLKALGRVENETQSGEEVTQQHADLTARLKNARETEQRMQAILQQRTGKIEDVLQVEQEIARVRGEIEQMEAELKSLEHRVDFATVTLNLSDVYQAQLTGPSSVGTRLRNGFVEGYHKAAETLLGIALFFIEVGPSLVIWLTLLGLPIFFVVRRYRRSLAVI